MIMGIHLEDVPIIDSLYLPLALDELTFPGIEQVYFSAQVISFAVDFHPLQHVLTGGVGFFVNGFVSGFAGYLGLFLVQGGIEFAVKLVKIDGARAKDEVVKKGYGDVGFHICKYDADPFGVIRL